MTTREKLAAAELMVAKLEKEIDDHECPEPDEYDLDGFISPHEAVDRWLDRQKLLGISPEGRAAVERLLSDLE